ncbi:MAG: hypothetical protein ABJH75_13895, partial [Roseibium sp.]
RVERLEPHFRNAKFYVPFKVYHPDYGEAVWEVDEKKAVLGFKPYEGPTKIEAAAIGRGEPFRVMTPIKRRDEDGNVYDLFRVFAEEFAFFPFSPRDDLIDAVSRIEDMDAVGPMLFADKFAGERRAIPPDV